LIARDPKVVFTIEVREQAAAVQERPAFAIEALMRARANGLDTMSPVFQAECGPVPGLIDGDLNRRAGLDRD
jgi:hypothetical protein